MKKIIPIIALHKVQQIDQEHSRYRKIATDSHLTSIDFAQVTGRLSGNGLADLDGKTGILLSTSRLCRRLEYGLYIKRSSSHP